MRGHSKSDEIIRDNVPLFLGRYPFLRLTNLPRKHCQKKCRLVHKQLNSLVKEWLIAK